MAVSVWVTATVLFGLMLGMLFSEIIEPTETDYPLPAAFWWISLPVLFTISAIGFVLCILFRTAHTIGWNEKVLCGIFLAGGFILLLLACFDILKSEFVPLGIMHVTVALFYWPMLWICSQREGPARLTFPDNLGRFLHLYFQCESRQTIRNVVKFFKQNKLNSSKETGLAMLFEYYGNVKAQIKEVNGFFYGGKLLEVRTAGEPEASGLVPYHTYFVDVDDCSSLGEREKVIYYCLMSRNRDGFIREKYLKKLLGMELPDFALRYVLAGCADRVWQIPARILEILENGEDNAVVAENAKKLHDFACAYPRLREKLYQRNMSYRDTYYREIYPKAKNYPAAILFVKHLGYERKAAAKK